MWKTKSVLIIATEFFGNEQEHVRWLFMIFSSSFMVKSQSGLKIPLFSLKILNWNKWNWLVKEAGKNSSGGGAGGSVGKNTTQIFGDSRDIL